MWCWVLLRRMEKFDPAVNKWAAFRAVVVYHTLTDIIRKHVGPDSEINRRADFNWTTASRKQAAQSRVLS